jgi:hypothetical protein
LLAPFSRFLSQGRQAAAFEHFIVYPAGPEKFSPVEPVIRVHNQTGQIVRETGYRAGGFQGALPQQAESQLLFDQPCDGAELLLGCHFGRLSFESGAEKGASAEKGDFTHPGPSAF